MEKKFSKIERTCFAITYSCEISGQFFSHFHSLISIFHNRNNIFLPFLTKVNCFIKHGICNPADSHIPTAILTAYFCVFNFHKMNISIKKNITNSHTTFRYCSFCCFSNLRFCESTGLKIIRLPPMIAVTINSFQLQDNSKIILMHRNNNKLEIIIHLKGVFA